MKMRHWRGKAGFRVWWAVGHTYHRGNLFLSVEKKITYLSSLLTTAGVGPGDSVTPPMRVDLYRHLLDKYFNEEKILK